MIQSLKALQQYLLQNNMKKTLQSLRGQILKQIPHKVSQQFNCMFESQQHKKQNNNRQNSNNNNTLQGYSASTNNKFNLEQVGLINRQKRGTQKKRQGSHLPVQGLLGKIAYSQKLISQNEMSEKINHLMDNKIFLKELSKLFPQTNTNTNKPNNSQRFQQHTQNNRIVYNKGQQQEQQHEYYDELDMVVYPDKTNNNKNINKTNNNKHTINHNNNNNNQQQQQQPSLLVSQLSITNNQISAIDFLHNNNQQYQHEQQQSSIISQHNKILDQFEHLDQSEQYTDDKDYGYEEHIFDQQSLMAGCQQLSKVYNYPMSAVVKQNKKDNSLQRFKSSIEQIQKLKFPQGMIFPSSQDPVYPLQYNRVSYDTMSIKVIYDRQRIGYQQQKQFQLKKGDIIAGRYQIQKILGSGVFAKVIKAKDLGSQNQELTCFKMIQNDKDFFDQALDQLKLLRYIKANCDPNQHYLLNFKQVFYHREHLFIQTDLLKDNLLTAFQNNPSFFSIQVIKKISIQLLQALATLHQMNIIHADLKPENIMVKSYNPIQVRVIDLGNGSFTHDQNLSNYVQSRSYRAPQVVLGCGYNEKIDVWSLGCILAQVWTKNVLFFNHHIQGMIARIQSIVGPWPQWMLQNGQNVVNLFSNQNFIYHHDKQKQLYHIFVPKRTTLKNRIRCDDQLFVDFIRSLVQIDPLKRLSALQAMEHPFLKS